jgi:hypothetical protein
MPNEWDAFPLNASPPSGAPTAPTMQPNEEFNETIGGADASSVAPLETVLARRGRRISWRNRSFDDKVKAALGSTANNIPIVGESLVPSDRPDVQEFRENAPIAAFGTNVVGSGLPFAGAAATRGGSAVLNRMFGSVPRAAASGGAIGYADAASRGQDPNVGAGINALFSTLGRGVARSITPRDPTHPQIAARNRAGSGPPQINDDMLPPGYTASDFGPELPAQRTIRERIARSLVTEQQRNERSLPTFNELPAWARMTLGGAGAVSINQHPIAGAIAGYAMPHVIRGARNVGNRVLRSKTLDRVLNNQILSPEQRSIIAAMGGSFAPNPDTLTGEER